MSKQFKVSFLWHCTLSLFPTEYNFNNQLSQTLTPDTVCKMCFSSPSYGNNTGSKTILIPVNSHLSLLLNPIKMNEFYCSNSKVNYSWLADKPVWILLLIFSYNSWLYLIKFILQKHHLHYYFISGLKVQ